MLAALPAIVSSFAGCPTVLSHRCAVRMDESSTRVSTGLDVTPAADALQSLLDAEKQQQQLNSDIDGV
jgi:hypothetical protein